GETIDAEIDARYFFDAPASNLDFTWNLSRLSNGFYLPGYIVGKFNSQWLSPSLFGNFGGFGEHIDSGEGHTSPQGEFALTLPIPAADETFQYTLELTIQDDSGFPVSTQSTFTAHPANFYIGVRPDVWVGQAEQSMNFDILAVDWASNPAGVHTIDASFSLVTWERENERFGGSTYTPKHKIIDSQTFTTDGQGSAQISFTPQEAGTYQVDLTSGGTVTQALVWVGGTGQAVWPNFAYNQIRLVADKNAYSPGETAQIFIPNPFTSDAQALVTTERGIVLDHQITAITGNGSTLQIGLSEESSPNIYLSVTVIGNQENGKLGYRQGLINLDVSAAAQTLTVEVLGQPQRAAPGEIVDLQLKITDSHGAPVQGEFSVSMVDQAVLALADPYSVDILTAFYGQQSLGVRTSASLVASSEQFEEFIGGMGGGGGGDDSVGPVRQDFQDTAFWQGNIVTGVDGLATVPVILPDNLTTWQVDVRGLTKNTLVGEGTTEVISTKPLLIRPVTPRFLIVGDEMQIGAIIHNNTTEDFTVSIALKATGFTLDNSSFAIQDVNISASGQVRLSWQGTAEDVTDIELIFAANGGGYQDTTLPASGLIPVYRYFAPKTFATAGTLDQQGERLELVSLPKSFDPTAGELTVTLSSSLASAVLDTLDWLEESSYESNEQLASRLITTLETFQVLDSHGMDTRGLDAKVNSRVRARIQKLQSNQSYDGGWGWGQYRESDPYITAYVLLGLANAQAKGYAVQDYKIDSAANFLIDYLQTTQEDRHQPWEYNRVTFIVYVLTQTNLFQAVDQALVLYEQRALLSPWAQALLASAWSQLPQGGQRVQTLVSDLESAAIRSATGAHWESESDSRVNMSSSIFNSATITRILLQNGSTSPLLDDAVRYLMAHRNASGGWQSTYASAWSVLALLEYIDSSGELSGDFEYSASINNSPIAEGHTAQGGELTAVTTQVPISSLLVTEPNALVLHRGDGGGRLYYTAALAVSQPVALVSNSNRGLSISRAYYTLGQDCTNQTCQSISTSSVGDLVQAKVTVTLPDDMYYLQVEDFIPSGAEILDLSLKTTQQNFDPYYKEEIEYFDVRKPFADGWGWWLFNSPIIRDNQITWTADYVPAGTYDLTYTLVLIHTGVYQVIPARSWQTYFPEVFGNAAGALFEILPEN
ncbi:MAG: hypothetical protein N2D54_03260, partial [Chloroflexota bacterium]